MEETRRPTCWRRGQSRLLIFWGGIFQGLWQNYPHQDGGMMNGPAQVFDRLIDAQAVFPTLGGPEAIVLDFQAPKHPHARLGQGVALDVLMLEISGHLLEVVLQEREDLL